MKVTDTILIEKWKSLRDAEAFTELVRRHSAMVYRVACRILQNPGHAEEVAQECFLLLAQNPSAVKHSPGGWLHALATCRALDRLKAERHRLNRETRYGEQVATISMPQWDDVQRYVDEIVDELPESLRAVIIYRYFEGHSLEDTARHLSVSRTTVQTRLTRSVARIRRALHRRGIPISTGMLLGSLGIGSSEAAPASLTLALGKLTVAGTTGTAAINTTTGILLTGGLLGMKKILILAGILAAAFLAKETLFKADNPTPSQYPAPATGVSSPTALVKKIPIAGTEMPPPKPSKDTSLIALLAQKLNGQENGSISGIVVDRKSVV